MSGKLFEEFKDNPIGKVIALIMFLVLLYALSSLSGFSPITNSTIANQRAAPPVVLEVLQGGAYTFVKPFGVILGVSLPVIIGVGYLTSPHSKGDVDVSLNEETEEE